MTAKVRDIISRIEAKEPLARVFRPELTKLVLSSSESGLDEGFADRANVSNESIVILLNEPRPGIRVFHVQ